MESVPISFTPVPLITHMLNDSFEIAITEIDMFMQ